MMPNDRRWDAGNVQDSLGCQVGIGWTFQEPFSKTVVAIDLEVFGMVLRQLGTPGWLPRGIKSLMASSVFVGVPRSEV